MCPFLRDSPVWDHRGNLRPTNSDLVSLCQPEAVKMLLEARDRSQLSQKWNIVEGLRHRMEGRARIWEGQGPDNPVDINSGDLWDITMEYGC